MNKEVLGGLYKGLAYRIQVNRPDKLNAINKAMWASIKGELENACASPAPVVLITGTDTVFSSGDDIDAMYRLGSLDESKEFFNKILEVIKAIIECPKPVVCEVKGLAAGGGAEMLLACDIVVASDDVWISFPEVALGLLPPLLITIGVKALGHRKVRYLALTGSRLSAHEAANLGLIDEVVPRLEIDNIVDDLIKTLASFPKESLALIKKLSLSDLDYELAQTSIDELAKLVVKPEAKERMRLFKEGKYKPAAIRSRKSINKC